MPTTIKKGMIRNVGQRREHYAQNREYARDTMVWGLSLRTAYGWHLAGAKTKELTQRTRTDDATLLVTKKEAVNRTARANVGVY